MYRVRKLRCSLSGFCNQRVIRLGFAELTEASPRGVRRIGLTPFLLPGSLTKRMQPGSLTKGTSAQLCRRPLFPRRLPHTFLSHILRKPAPTRESPRKVCRLSAHYTLNLTAWAFFSTAVCLRRPPSARESSCGAEKVFRLAYGSVLRLRHLVSAFDNPFL